MKSPKIKILTISFLISFLSLSAKAQMIGIENPDPNDFPIFSISDDGNIIVGPKNFGGQGKEVFVIRNGVVESFSVQNFQNVENISFTDISGDGNKIAVNTYDDNFENRKIGIYENGNFEFLAQPLGVDVLIYDISYDGSVIIGDYIENNVQKAFKIENGVFSNIPSLGGDLSYASAVSGNGKVIAGESRLVDGGDLALFKYENGVVRNIGGSGLFSRIRAISFDGSVIVGDVQNTQQDLPVAFKYTDDSGINILGTLEGGNTSYAEDVSYSGKVIVGSSTIDDNFTWHAFKYTDEEGMIDLGTLGGASSFATAITSDGSVIIGYSETENVNEYQIFMIRGDAQDGPSTMVSVDNTLKVLSQNANQLNSVLNLSESLLNYSLNQDAKLFGKNNMHFAFGSRLATVDKSREVGGIFKFAYRFNDNFRAGIFLDYGFADDLPNNFSSNNYTPLTTFFATLGENKDDLGLFLKLSASYNSTNLDITRQAIENTEGGKGETSLISKAASAKIGYGLKLNKNLAISPYVGVRASDILRRGYSEIYNADFPITFKGARKKSTTALFGVNSQINFDKLELRAGIGGERDISASLDGYVGNIYFLGAFDLSPKSIKEKRYFANLGTSYKISENQEISFDINYLKQSLNSSNSIIAFANYAIGF